MQREGSPGGASKLNTNESENQRRLGIISDESLHQPFSSERRGGGGKKKKQSLTALLMPAAAYWKAKATEVHKAITQRAAGQKTKGGGGGNDGDGCETERPRPWRTHWEIWDVESEMRDVLKWGPLKISRWVTPLIFASAFFFTLWGLGDGVYAIACLCVCLLVVVPERACLILVKKNKKHAFKATAWCRNK